ncbi:LysE/ArgO family amino acid transporter [Roseateles oligotrophus]|uniref:LysE/ArgO family amino acid transporter n=1 Tax=Roseateles oligotrophus TaxID=1769250 RepID=A0ABT2YKC6_9BURK|nr:LysE/ArgO family amino acid transporter [Roseateles oligotrophus]MCV2370508.1 LysE/ArgO family amino acid transporter [Roseateles oligotrophus]
MNFNATHLSTYTQGLLLGASLIVAIGAQNAFVLRQALRREHVTVIVLACGLTDAVLMAAGVFGLAALINAQPLLTSLISWAGALFLTAYGLRALWRARRPGADLHAAQGPSLSLAQALLQLAGFTLLNPHVYLDTVMLVGSVGAQQPTALRLAFMAGAASGSMLWFALLGYGGRWLAPWFARPRAWQLLDALIGITMLALAAMLVIQT